MAPALLGTTRSTSPDSDAPPERPDEEILEEARERRDYAAKAWELIRDEGRKDVMCVAGDVWQAMDPNGLDQRRDAKRPAVSCDEIGQYLNQTGNDVRQNKRGVKVTPTGNGANDKTAQYRQGRIRQIEYESNAQRDVYSPIFEDALQRSYGFGRIVSKYVSDTSRKMKLLLEAFPNPDVVLPDPDGAMLAPDCSKIQWAFILDASHTRKAFKREFPDAQIVDFTDEHARLAPEWIKGDHITLAEYWLIEKQPKRVVFLKIAPDRGWFVSSLPRVPLEDEIDDERTVEVPYVCQYLTNGVELLAKKGQRKRTPWPGRSIPIFSCFGKVLYVQTGSGTERRMLSMVRLMREPVMGLAYTRTCQVEILGSVPRTTWVGYEGQFRGHETDWQKANHEPVPYLQVKPRTEATGGEVLPLPQRQSWDPPLQNTEMMAEAFRRSIQAAAGTSPLPTEAQRQNQKSGKALDRIESSGQKGSFHFVDHLDGMITRVGVMLDELLPFYDDTAGEVTVRKPDDQSAPQRINDPADPESVPVSADHEHDITLSVGPAKESERQASSDFADEIVANQALIQVVGPQKAAELMALAIRLKDVGPIGDEMADTISPKPPDEGQPPTPEQLARQVAESQATIQQLQLQLQEAMKPTAVEEIRQQGATQIKAMELDFQREKLAVESETKIAVAELSAKMDRIELFLEERARLGVEQENARARAHEVGMSSMQQQADAEEAERGRQAESEEAQRARQAAASEAAAGRLHEADMAAEAAKQQQQAGA